MDRLGLSRRARAALAVTDAVLDPTADTRHLNDLVCAVVAVTHSPSGAVAVLTDRQVAVLTVGEHTEASRLGDERPFEDTICVNALRTGRLLAIPDTSADHRVSSLPQVVDGTVASYLGAPLHTPADDMIGVLCVWDRQPRVWTADEVAGVSRIAGEVAVELTRLEAEAR